MTNDPLMDAGIITICVLIVSMVIGAIIQNQENFLGKAVRYIFYAAIIAFLIEMAAVVIKGFIELIKYFI